MHRASFHRVAVLGALAGALPACGADAAASGDLEGDPTFSPEGEADIGQVQLELAAVPTGVRCIRTTVTDAVGNVLTVHTAASTPTATWSATIALGSFVSGTIQVSAKAYSVVCTDVDVVMPAPSPTWVTQAIAVNVVPGAKPVAVLNFRQVIPVAATANFASSVVSVAVGSGSTGFVLADGTVRMVGYVGSPPTSFTNVVELSVGSDHACARKGDGTVWCWGADGFGQLGNGPTVPVNHTTPVQVTGLTGITTLSASSYYLSCASNQWTTYCWGDNGSGALGNGTFVSSNVPVQVSGIQGSAKVATGYSRSCAVLQDGTVRCWGSGYLGNGGTNTSAVPVTVTLPTTPATPLRGVVSLATGLSHTCAIDVQGKVYCWGGNTDGQIGNGTVNAALSPVVVSGGLGNGSVPVAELALGHQHSCARTTAGAVHCWGNGQYVGDGTAANRTAPVHIASLPAVQGLAASGYPPFGHTCALLPDVSVWCWGDNAFGELADGTFATRFKPTPALL